MSEEAGDYNPWGWDTPVTHGDYKPHIAVKDQRRHSFFIVDNVILDQFGQALGPYGLAFYMALCRHANREMKCWPSYETIAREAGMSERQAQREAKKCVSLGLIRIQKRFSDPEGEHPYKSNIFTLLHVQEGGDTQSPPYDTQSPEQDT